MAEELVIVVATKKAKDKGGFDIIDTLGVKYLLSAKNASLSDALIEGRASKISVAKTSYGAYINSAVLFDGKPSVAKPNPLAEEAVKLGAEIIPDTKDTKIRSMALSYVKDIVIAQVRAGVIKEINEGLYQQILRRATEWANWIEQ